MTGRHDHWLRFVKGGRFMRGTAGYLLLGFFILFALTACSKQPVQEINAAKSAVDSAMAEGAEKYSPAEAKRVNDALAEATNEVKKEDAKFFKNYNEAKQMLSAVKTDADNLRSSLAAKKEEAKKKALAAEESARAAVNGAKESLTNAMKSTKAGLDIEVLSNNVKGLDDSLAEIRKLISTEDFTTAIEKANALKERAEGMSEEAGKGRG